MTNYLLASCCFREASQDKNRSTRGDAIRDCTEAEVKSCP